MHNYTDAVNFWMMGSYVGVLDKNGIFDAYRPDGTGMIRNWKDTIKTVVEYRFVALLDRNGILQVYRAPDGLEVLRADGVTDMQEVSGGVQYLRAGQWIFQPM